MRSKLRLAPVSIAVLIFVADLIVDGAIGLHYDVFTSDSSTPGILHDYMALITDFLFDPIVAGLYLWSPDGTTRLFNQLQNSRIFLSEDAVVDTVNSRRSLYHHPAAFVVIILSALVFTTTQIGGYVGWMPWRSVGGYLDLVPQASFFRAPFWFLVFYGLCFAVYNVAITIVTLRAIFRSKEIRLVPLHPDGCGGLGSISRYTINVAYGIGVVGLMLTAAVLIELQTGSLSDSYPVLVGVGAYMLAAPLIFFWPLGTAHEAMQNTKDQELLILAQSFDESYTRVKQEEGRNFEKAVERLEQIRTLYKMADDFPVWPFDFRSLRRFFTVVGAPLLPAIISIAQEIVKEMIR